MKPVYIEDFFYKNAQDENFFATAKADENAYMYRVHRHMLAESLQNFCAGAKKRRGLFYAGGPMQHHSMSRTFPNTPPKSSNIIKSQSSMALCEWARYFGGITFASINANTCASGLYALYEAYNALANGVLDEALIVSEEWTEPNEYLLFEQLGIDIRISDAFCVLKLSGDKNVSRAVLDGVNWNYKLESSPFGISKEGYINSMSPFSKIPIDAVKMHASGTSKNADAEHDAIHELFGDIRMIDYKRIVGHSQGTSAALETAMLLDIEPRGTYLVNSSGLGGFYGCAKIIL